MAASIRGWHAVDDYSPTKAPITFTIGSEHGVRPYL
jgi:hypothetical protein